MGKLIIPQYHSVTATSYRIDLLIGIVRDWQNKNQLDLMPDFQRGHVWTEEQKIKFIEFYLMGGTVNPIYFNWSPNLDEKQYRDFVIVDGLQRLTAFMEFYDGKFKAHGYTYAEFEKFARDASVDFRWPWIDAIMLEYPTKAEVLKFYYFLNSGGTPHSKEEIDRVHDMIVELNRI